MTLLGLARSFFGAQNSDLGAAALAEPEPVNTVARPMTGFFTTLTEEQQRRALEYRGPDYYVPARD